MDLPDLNVRLLGGFHITLNGETLISLNQLRQQSLIAYLMLHAAAPQSRQQLAFNFWPDSSEDRAFANLRYALHHLRRACPQLDSFLQITQSTVQWLRLPTFHLDVDEYESCLKRAASADETNGDTMLASEFLIQALNLYPGDLLPDCYDDWIIPIRERLSQSHLESLQQLIDNFAAQEKYQSAIDYALQLRNSDPLAEDSYRRLMELYERIGNRSAALRLYHECLTVLDRELGIEPAPETRAIYERILAPTASLPVSTLPHQSKPAVVATVTREKFVGRRQELQILHAVWQRAKAGHPHFVLIRGEAGIGKTRLAEEFLLWATQNGHLTARTRAYAAEGQLAYAPVVGWLRGEAYREKLRTLDKVWLAELARLLPELAAEMPDLPQLAPLTDSLQRQRLFEALAHAVLVVGQSAKQPLLVLLDDLQWADQETLEWLHFLLRCDLNAALLLVGTARIEEIDESHPLTALLRHLSQTAGVSEIDLGALDAEASAELAQQIANRPLDAEILAALYSYAEGIPLFLVEAVRAESGRGAFESWRGRSHSALELAPANPSVAIPPRIYAVIQARLAQLSAPARQMADLAAVIGRSFTVELLAQAGEANESELITQLDELWKRRILRERGVEYDISHDRIRDVTYAEITPIQRRLLHRRVAQALERANAADLDAVSAQLAWHYERAAAPKRAIDYYQRAGMAAQRIYANNDALRLFTKGLSLLDDIGDSTERDQRELSLQIAIAASTRSKNYLSVEVDQALKRALALSRKVDDGERHFWPLWGIHLDHFIRGDIRAAHELIQSLLTIAEQDRNPYFLLAAHSMGGGVEFFRGDPLSAQNHFEQAALCYPATLHEEQVLLTGFNHGIHSLAWSAHSLWFMGRGDEALYNGQRAVALAQELGHPFSLVLALAYLAMLYQFRGECEAAQVQADAALALATRHEIGYYGAWAAILSAWATATSQPGPEEVAILRDALQNFRAPGSGLRWPYYLSLLAEVYANAGEDEAALARIAEALEVVSSHGERCWEAELHRLRGEALLAQGAELSVVEDAFQLALTLARRDHALPLELRAATKLAYLWQKSRRHEAFQLLSAVYSQFSQGFDTQDLQEAKRLLAELSSEAPVS